MDNVTSVSLQTPQLPPLVTLHLPVLMLLLIISGQQDCPRIRVLDPKHKIQKSTKYFFISAGCVILNLSSYKYAKYLSINV
jgi:hypothetical protein